MQHNPQPERHDSFTGLLPAVSFPVFTSCHVRVLVSEATRLHKLARNSVSVQQDTKTFRSLSERPGVLAEARMVAKIMARRSTLDTFLSVKENILVSQKPPA
jgi:hypothetical protein